MKIDERALLQERVRTLVLRPALEAVLDRLASAARDAGRDAEAEFHGLEQSLIAAARAVEDASTTIRAAFDNAHERLDVLRPSQLTLVEPEAAVAA